MAINFKTNKSGKIKLENLLIFLIAVYLIFSKLGGNTNITDDKILPSDLVAETSSSALQSSEAWDFANLTPTPQAAQVKKPYPVTKVVDGDTINVLIDDKKEVIRLLGIDTPETVDPKKPVGCYGKEASDKAKQLMTNQYVFLVSDSTQDDKDKYGRLLRYVYLTDGTFVNKQMIVQGYAHEYTYDAPYFFQKEFRNDEKLAKDAKLGLWNQQNCPVN